MLSLGRAAFNVPFRTVFTTPLILKGHSKWQNIKDTKGKNDLIKSQKMNSLLKRVKTAAQQGGFDLKLNKKLADLQQEFKANGLSLDTFNGYITKLKNKPDMTFHYDLIGPSGTFFIVEAEGDNKSKLQSSVTKILKKVGGFRFANDSLRNRFEEKGIVKIGIKDSSGNDVRIADVEELAIELDCEDVNMVDDGEDSKVEFMTQPGNVSKVESVLSEKGYVIESAESELVPLHYVSITDTDSAIIEKFYEQLQELEEIKQIYDNVEQQEAQAVPSTG